MTKISPASVSIIKASAGSGKTYILTKRFIQLLLSKKLDKSNLSNILAITFSNNAAKEMKERILRWLKDIALECNESHISEILNTLQLERKELVRKANEQIFEILDNYSDFQVKTIDSFMTSIFRAMPFQFGIENIDIVMDIGNIFRYAFEMLLREVKESSNFALLIENAIDKIIDTSTTISSYPWDPFHILLKEIKGLYRKITSVGKYPISEDTEILAHLIKEIKEKKKFIENLIQKFELTINKASSWSNFCKIIESETFADLLNIGFNRPPIKKEKRKQEIYQQVFDLWKQIEKLVSEYAVIYSMAFYNPYLQVFNKLKGFLDEAKKQHGIIFIEDINFLLSEYISQSNVPDIYFYIGEKIYHWLIDEFQDTSPIQWRNLKPLIENALSEGGTLFVVGDMKQSIYGFREADYKIMKSLEEHFPFPCASCEIEEFFDNYRSCKEILNFTDMVFKENIKKSPYAEAAQICGLTTYNQKSIINEEGFVEVTSVENDLLCSEKLIQLIKALLYRGYKHRDIAILTHNNYDVIKLSTWLNNNNIPFISYSSLDIRRRKITMEIVSLLKFFDSPMDNLSFATFLLSELFSKILNNYGIKEITKENIRDFIFKNSQNPLYKAFKQEFPYLWKRFFEKLFKLSGYLPIYDMLVSLYYTFKVFDYFPQEEATLVRLLEVTKNAEGKGISNLKDFLRLFEEDKDESVWTLNAPKYINAVKVMTIHKAKGLGFPIVILIIYGKRLNKGFPYIIVDMEDKGLRILRINKKISSKKDFLHNFYKQEIINAQIDALNTLYVGLTRAEKEMYLFLIKEKDKKSEFPLDILPEQYISYSKERLVKYNSLDIEKLKKVKLSFQTEPYIYETEYRKIDFYKKQKGEAIHRLLKEIIYIDENEENIEEKILKISDTINCKHLTESIKKDIVNLLNIPVIKQYFQKKQDRTVFVEKEFSDQWGNLYRMDRVIVDKESVIVIDFKTGISLPQEEEKYKKQIKTYMNILSNLYPDKKIEGLVVFIKPFKTVSYTLKRL